MSGEEQSKAATVLALNSQKAHVKIKYVEENADRAKQKEDALR